MITLSALIAPLISAHQPVMDMAPRWEHGYGFQVRIESAYSKKLQKGSSETENPFNLHRRVTTTWLEGIYTFKRELRFTLKIPYHRQDRTALIDGARLRLKGRGLGDIIIGVPIKSYRNFESSTRNIAFTPSLRLPTGSTADDFPGGDGSVDLGLSFSASFEEAKLYQYYDLFFWWNGEGDDEMQQGNQIGFDANIGWHPWHNNLQNQGVFLMMDLTARYEKKGRDRFGITGGKSLSLGPVLVYYKEGTMIRIEYKYPVFDDANDIQLAQSPQLNLGIGFVF